MKYFTDGYCNEIKMKEGSDWKSVITLSGDWTVEHIEIDDVRPCEWVTVKIKRFSQPVIGVDNNGAIRINGR